MIERRFPLRKLCRKLLADVVFSHESGQIRKRVQRLDCKPRLVILVLDRKQRSALDPSMADAKIFREALLVICRTHELVRAPQVVPFIAGKRYVPTLHCIIIHCDDE